MIEQKIILFTCAISPQEWNLRWILLHFPWCISRLRQFRSVPLFLRRLTTKRGASGSGERSLERKGGRIGGLRVFDVCRRSITLRLTSGRVYSRTAHSAHSGSSERISRVSRRAPLNLHFICFISGCLLFFFFQHAQPCNVYEFRRIARRAPREDPVRSYNPLRRMRRRCVYSYCPWS